MTERECSQRPFSLLLGHRTKPHSPAPPPVRLGPTDLVQTNGKRRVLPPGLAHTNTFLGVTLQCLSHLWRPLRPHSEDDSPQLMSAPRAEPHLREPSPKQSWCASRFPQPCFLLWPNGHLPIIKEPPLEFTFLEAFPEHSSPAHV